MSEWVSVKERLPDDPSWVLVCADGAINCMGWGKGEWQDFTQQRLPNVITSQITHWMPLPEPPAIMGEEGR